MATEELIVLLDAKTQKLDAKLKATEKRLDELDGGVKKTDSSLKKFSKAGGVAAGVLLKLGAATLALSAAVSAMVLASASGRRELEILSKQAKTSTADFQALAFAASRYGVSAEQVGDISKDISDKIGEFAAAGTGAFQDYADVMKLSQRSAREAANEFEGLSSQEVLGKMVSRMEDAGVSGDKMIFVLESLGNDSSKLIPLLADNSKELLTMKARFDGVNNSMQITSEQAEALKDVSETFKLLQSTSINATDAISSTLAPALEEFFNGIIDIVPDATQTIINFLKSFMDADNATLISDKMKEIGAIKLQISDIENKSLASGSFRATMDEATLQISKDKLAVMQEELLVLEGQRFEIAEAERLKGGEIKADKKKDPLVDTGLGTGDEIQEIEDRFKLEETLLAEKLQRELKMIGKNYGLRLDLIDEFEDNVKGLQKDRDKQEEKNKKVEEDREKKKKEFKLDQARGFTEAASILNSALFNDNKAIAAGLIIADTAAAVMKSLSISPFDYANVAVIVATGIAQLSNALSSSPGGGSASGAGSAPSTQTPDQQEDFRPETTTLDITDQTTGGRASGTITFATDTGDDLVNAISQALNRGIREGRF
jgi:hypothetical protein